MFRLALVIDKSQVSRNVNKPSKVKSSPPGKSDWCLKDLLRMKNISYCLVLICSSLIAYLICDFSKSVFVTASEELITPTKSSNPTRSNNLRGSIKAGGGLSEAAGNRVTSASQSERRLNRLSSSAESKEEFYSSIRRVLSLNDEGTKKESLIKVLVACDDVRLILEAVEYFDIDMKDLSGVVPGFPEILHTRIMERDGYEFATKWIEKKYVGLQNFNQVSALFGVLSQQDPDMAATVFQSFSSYEKEQRFGGLFFGALQRGWNDTLSILVDFKEYHEENPHHDVYGALSSLAFEWPEEKLEEMLESFPTELSKERLVENLALSKVNEDFSSAEELLELIEEGPQRDSLEVALLRKHSAKNPEKVGEILRDERPEMLEQIIGPLMSSFLHSSPDSGVKFVLTLDEVNREEIMPEFVAHWFRRAPEEATTWIAGAEENHLKDLVLSSVSIQAEEDSTQSGFLWAGEIRDDEIRENTLENLRNN